ncbi:helix-turn-helix domain-containing protein [Nocardia bovistercoris]|uniref:Helix-turn-helix transcriptional regulator n=1 Tax=Nocardia bovistercoris TaxID=2785916 RepID=A0A931IBV4_9NOCA|nr:helix-turn-helix transcriptional regulator [Nocardia bovistercoris]MBH0777706.1 helix-turn-helix transcriptional regulator [Nocardia bovistercoris]
MATTSPTVARWELKLRIVQLRKDSQLDDAEVMDAVGISRPYWSQVFGGSRILTVDKLRALAAAYGCDADEQEELVALRETATKERGWWMKHPALIRPEMQQLYGLEHGAHSIRCYNSLLIPGLLQSEGYARTIIAANTMIRPFEVEQHLAVRMQRQSRLTGENPLHLTAVFSEAALIQQTGGPDVLREQLLHLIELAERNPETIEYRIIPFTAAEGTALGGSTFHLLDFGSTKLPTLGWSETPTQADVVEDAAEVSSLTYAYAQALTQTLNPADSLTLIKERARE